MQILLAWAVYLVLGVGGLALGWGWLAPRLPRRVRWAILGLLAGLSVLALAVTAQIPHDYRADDLSEYGRGVAALGTELLVAVAGGTVALAAIGRRRTQNAGLCGAGLYLAGTGLVLDAILDGQPTLQAPLLLFAGTAVGIAGAGRLARLPRWLACAFALTNGLVVVLAVETLRGTGNRGGPATALPTVVLLAGSEVVLLLLGGALLVRAHRRVLARPLARAAAGLVGTGLVLILRGSGEWAPRLGAPSTTLYGLPLTLLVVAVSLAILDAPARWGRAPGRPRPGPARLRPAFVLLPAGPLLGGLLLLCGLLLLWRPAPDPCIAAPYGAASPRTPAGPAWALSPAPAAPRGAPDVAAFDRVCTHRAPDPSQLLYAYYPTCKWAQVDPNYPLVQASGILRDIVLSNADSPWIHTSHDLNLDLAVDPASAWLVLGGATDGALLHGEVESGPFPVPYRPVAGDRVTIAGRWIFDCGHDPKTEIHPAAIVASEHDEWRADTPGRPQRVRVLRVWMNSAPGVVTVPRAPFDLRIGFPTRPPGPVGTPIIRVTSGAPDAVQWTINAGAGPGPGPEAAVHIAPPAAAGSAYFELLLGYQQAAPAPQPQTAYTVAFDRLIVADNLQRAARNTTGIALADLLNPELGIVGTGHWFLQAIVDHDWRALLADAPVASGHAYSLAAVPPVSILATGGEHLPLAITGYVANDPSDGVELASGSVSGAALLSWDAGRLADLCCGPVQTFTPAHGAWTLAYHVSNARP